MGDCRPLGFLIGLPFALVSLVLSLIGAVIWVIGSVLSCLCPCFCCCAGLANMAVDLIKLPIKVIRWFTEQIPC
ncbi:signaling peptide TAXIMIN 2 [Impatiens glandulifera]|uniref:signaling peptide TAXIMIN 2 n=1 Tax=Impatiens glandulifera TaxID=253017 RepID=UPI001FB0D062|nr:signaling peptide TAXIMIN 2 [Impatiens glandulifera]